MPSRSLHPDDDIKPITYNWGACLHFFEDEIASALWAALNRLPFLQSFKGALPTNEPKDHLRVVLRAKAGA